MLVVLLLVVFAAGALVAAVMLHTPELAWCSLLRMCFTIRIWRTIATGYSN